MFYAAVEVVCGGWRTGSASWQERGEGGGGVHVHVYVVDVFVWGVEVGGGVIGATATFHSKRAFLGLYREKIMERYS